MMLARRAVLDLSLDARDELAAESGMAEPLEKLWFRKLASAVVDADRCVKCGTCIAACPSNSISIAEDDRPTLVRMCTGCSLCWTFCPRAGLRYERLWTLLKGGDAAEGVGPVKAAYTAKALSPSPRAQDGGVVTTILEELLKAGEIDGALVARSVQGPFRGEAYIAKTLDEVRGASGSVYDQTSALASLVDLSDYGLDEESEIAMVGTPCEVTGIKALQRFGWKHRKTSVSNVKYVIALLCTRNFDPGRLVRRLGSKGISIGKIKKMDVRHNVLRLYDEAERVVFEDNCKRFREAALRGCDECADFSGRLADISVGSIGSPRGFSTVLIRTEQGKNAWNISKKSLEYRSMDTLNAVGRIEARNLQKAVKSLKRRFDPKAPLWIDYEEHLMNYVNTDRAPVKPPSYRIHHYETTC